MSVRLSALIVSACLCGTAAAQTAAPVLTRPQRELLRAVVQAVDAAAGQPKLPDSAWPVHLLRASDGSHYVAFSIEPPDELRLPAGPVMLYVRLATIRPEGAVTAFTERSIIREWLAGQRIDPRLLPGRGIAIGEMPAFGAGAIAARGSTASTGSTDLNLMALERERARQDKDARDKQRRAEMEGKALGLRNVLPFEDFDLASRSVAADGTRQISRALTAGPGDYELFIGWADPAAVQPSTTIHVLKRSLRLSLTTTDVLDVSSVILADNVAARSVPYPPAEQAAHPYALGPTEITPARDSVFTPDERLAVAVQVINPRPSASGKPDIAVGFRIVRLNGDRETPVASLTSLTYNEQSMPADFDLRLGHPLFAAMSAPLATLSRGNYRLRILVNDRLSGTARTAETDFTIAATRLSLLAEAPPLAQAFQRDVALAPPMLGPILTALSPSSASPALRRALDTAGSGKLLDLLVEEPVPAGEQGVRTALTGLALLSVGDASSAITFQRALQLGGPAAPVQWLIGAAHAAQGRDAEAIVAWRAALAEGLPRPVVTTFLVDAYLRRGEGNQAEAIITDGAPEPATALTWSRSLAAAHVASGHYRDAINLLTKRVIDEPSDADARWLLLHALYASIVHGDADNVPRFAEAGRAYRGANEALVTEWLRAAGSK